VLIRSFHVLLRDCDPTWIDATYVKVREGARIISVAVIIAVGANADGRREVLGMTVGPSEAEPFWIKFLGSMTARGLRGVKLEISDSHEGLKKAVRKVFSATWQCCSVHFMRNALASVNVKQRGMVAAAIRTAFAQEAEKEACGEWAAVADRLRERFRGVATLMDEARDDVLAYSTCRSTKAIGVRFARPIRSSASIARLSAAPMSRASSQTRTLSSASSAQSCSSRTTSGP
jgi:putative transposase